MISNSKKRIMVFLLTFIALISAVSYSLAEIQYQDSSTGISFSIPEGWVKGDLEKERQTIDVKYVRKSQQEFGVLLFGSTDVWESLTPDMKKEMGNQRSNLNNSLFSTSDMNGIGENIRTVTKKEFNGYEYFYALAESSMLGIDFETIFAVRYSNGYQYMFQLMSPKGVSYEKDLNSILTSAKYSNEVSAASSIQYRPETSANNTAAVSSAPGGGFWVSLLISIIITACVYTLPIVAYRLIKKEPLDAKKAKKVTIIYAICAFIAMSILLRIVNGADARTGYSIILWSYINYKILTSGSKTIGESNSAGSRPDTPEEQETAFPSENEAHVAEDANSLSELDSSLPGQMFYCNNCGNRLTPGSKYCNACGAPIMKRDA